MCHSAVLRVLRRQVTERADGLFCVPVNHHLTRAAEEVVQVAAALLAAVGDIARQLWSQIDGCALYDGLGFTVGDGEA